MKAHWAKLEGKEEYGVDVDGIYAYILNKRMCMNIEKEYKCRKISVFHVYTKLI